METLTQSVVGQCRVIPIVYSDVESLSVFIIFDFCAYLNRQENSYAEPQSNPCLVFCYIITMDICKF